MKLSNILARLLILAIPFYFIRFSIGPFPTTLLEVAIYIVFFYMLFSGNLKIKLSKYQVISILLFVIIGLVAAILDPDKIRGLGLWKGYFFDGLLVYLIFTSQDKKRDLIDYFLYSAVLTSLIALLLYTIGIKSIDNRLLDLDRLSPNYLAMFLSPAAVIGLYQIYKNYNASNILSTLVILVTIYLTGSRGAIISLIGALIIFIFYKIRAKSSLKANVYIILALLAFLIGGYSVYKPDWTDHSRKATSSNVRYYIWETSLEIIKEKPILGVGLGNYQDYFSNLTKDRVNFPEFISPVALTAHNLFLHVYIAMGFFGLLAFIFLLVASNFHRYKNPAVSLAIFAVIFYGLVDTPFFRNDLAVSLWFLLALADKELK